jgi:polysaccharide deacetylase 2 family uncharacterized protein YibQ
MAKRRAQRRSGTDWFITWPLLIVFAAMVFLASEEIRNPKASHPVSSTAPVGADWEERLPGRIDDLTHALEGWPVPLGAAVEEPKGAGSLRWIHRRFDVALPSSDNPKLESSLEALKQIDSGVTVASHPTFDGVEVQVGLDGLLTHTLRIHWQEKPVRPRIALVVGPLGDDLRLARECVSIEAPLAVLVQPDLPFSKEVGELAKIFKREVLVEIEAPDSPSPSSTVEDALAQALASVPGAVGVSGAATAGDGGAEKLRDLVQAKGLFFVAQGRRAAGVPANGPDAALLLDEEQENGMEAQLDKLVVRARGEGSAIGFTRSNSKTIAALGPLIEKLRKEEIDIVPVSSIAPGVALSAR